MSEGKEEEKEETQLLPVTHVAGLLVDAMRHRRRIGRCFVRENQEKREHSIPGKRESRSRMVGREARGYTQSQRSLVVVARYLAGSKIAIAPTSPDECCCFLGAGAMTHTSYVPLVSSSLSGCQCSLHFYTQTRHKGFSCAIVGFRCSLAR